MVGDAVLSASLWSLRLIDLYSARDRHCTTVRQTATSLISGNNYNIYMYTYIHIYTYTYLLVFGVYNTIRIDFSAGTNVRRYMFSWTVSDRVFDAGLCQRIARFRSIFGDISQTHRDHVTQRKRRLLHGWKHTKYSTARRDIESMLVTTIKIQQLAECCIVFWRKNLDYLRCLRLSHCRSDERRVFLSP